MCTTDHRHSIYRLIACNVISLVSQSDWCCASPFQTFGDRTWTRLPMLQSPNFKRRKNSKSSDEKYCCIRRQTCFCSFRENRPRLFGQLRFQGLFRISRSYPCRPHEFAMCAHGTVMDCALPWMRYPACGYRTGDSYISSTYLTCITYAIAG